MGLFSTAISAVAPPCKTRDWLEVSCGSTVRLVLICVLATLSDSLSPLHWTIHILGGGKNVVAPLALNQGGACVSGSHSVSDHARTFCVLAIGGVLLDDCMIF